MKHLVVFSSGLLIGVLGASFWLKPSGSGHSLGGYNASQEMHARKECLRTVIDLGYAMRINGYLDSIDQAYSGTNSVQTTVFEAVVRHLACRCPSGGSYNYLPCNIDDKKRQPVCTVHGFCGDGFEWFRVQYDKTTDFDVRHALLEGFSEMTNYFAARNPDQVPENYVDRIWDISSKVAESYGYVDQSIISNELHAVAMRDFTNLLSSGYALPRQRRAWWDESGRNPQDRQ